MRWPALRTAGLTLLFCFSCFCHSAAAQTASADDNQQKLAELMKNLEQVKMRLDKKASRQSDIEKAIRQSEVQIGKLAAERRQLNGQREQLDRELAQLQQQGAALQTQIDQQKTLINEQLLGAYKVGNRNPIQLLLENGNPADIDRHLQYLERVNRARFQLLDDFAQLLRKKQQNTEQLERSKQSLSETIAALNQRGAEIKASQAKRRQALAGLRQEITSDQARLDKLNEDSKALQALIEQMSAAVAKSPTPITSFTLPANIDSFAKARGQLPWPVPGKARQNSNSQWQGVTIAADKGSAVQAIFPGRVIFADWFRGQGLLMIIDHGDNYWSLYGHNEALLKSSGDTVVAGEPISTVGNSGGQALDALYFEIRHQGQPQSPRRWCKS